MLLKRLPSTILLMGCSLVVSLALSIPLGLIAGYKKNTSSISHIASGKYHVPAISQRKFPSKRSADLIYTNAFEC